jgi:hypothetical protein
MHCRQRGQAPAIRPLNDIDFLADSFDDIPKTLSSDFLFRHVHPHDPPGKTLLQGVDPETSVRLDVFRADGGTMGRAKFLEGSDVGLCVIGLGDLTARIVRLCLDLVSGTSLPAKHARDCMRLLPLTETEAMEAVWQEHRKTNHPVLFRDAAGQVEDLIRARTDLQVVPVYSQDPDEICARCMETEAFPLADSRSILALLGYC